MNFRVRIYIGGNPRNLSIGIWDTKKKLLLNFAIFVLGITIHLLLWILLPFPFLIGELMNCF